MAVTKWAHESGNVGAVLPGGDRAYTVWHAQDFQKIGRWKAGTAANTNAAQPGWIVFFDWGGTDGIGAIDHVGVVVRSLGGGYVETIEGNTSDACAVKRRHYSTIAGFGRPAYGSANPPKAGSGSSGNIAGMLDYGDTGAAVRTLQANLNKLGAKPALAVDGDFGPATQAAVKAFQKARGLEVDGIVGPKTEAAIKAALGGSQPAPSTGGTRAPAFPGRLITQPPIMYGNDVRTWQSRMKARGWNIAVDGAYGPASEDVCRTFQAEKRLGVDGIVGPKTWAAAWTSPIT